MSHEPECPYTPVGHCSCKEIRVAYKRGREDAADEILKAGYQRSLNLGQAAKIARGDAKAATEGEQK